MEKLTLLEKANHQVTPHQEDVKKHKVKYSTLRRRNNKKLKHILDKLEGDKVLKKFLFHY